VSLENPTTSANGLWCSLLRSTLGGSRCGSRLGLILDGRGRCGTLTLGGSRGCRVLLTRGSIVQLCFGIVFADFSPRLEVDFGSVVRRIVFDGIVFFSTVVFGFFANRPPADSL
jgi:hypothetical protein